MIKNYLNPRHGNISCEKLMEKEFMDWKKNKRVKRCPRCKIYNEKKEGCNHMTYTVCKSQWCWLCEGMAKVLLLDWNQDNIHMDIMIKENVKDFNLLKLII